MKLFFRWLLFSWWLTLLLWCVGFPVFWFFSRHGGTQKLIDEIKDLTAALWFDDL